MVVYAQPKKVQSPGVCEEAYPQQIWRPGGRGVLQQLHPRRQTAFDAFGTTQPTKPRRTRGAKADEEASSSALAPLVLLGFVGCVVPKASKAVCRRGCSC